MKYIIAGTNRPESRSMAIAKLVRKIYEDLGENTEIIDLRELPLQQLDGSQYSKNKPAELESTLKKVLSAQGLIFVCPEYNGSVPGILKYFIDHWPYPDSFSFRPCCVIGLGGRFGALRPVEHLQQILSYRDAFIFPLRVFLPDIWNLLDDQGRLTNDFLNDLLKQQAQGFCKFVNALEQAGLDANSYLQQKEGAPN